MTQKTQLPILDTSARWRHDLSGLCALAGGSAFSWVAAFEPVHGLALVLGGAVAGGLVGALAGGTVRRAVDTMRRRLPLWAIAMLSPVIGAGLGVLVGELALLLALPALGLPASAWAFGYAAVYILAPVGALLGTLLWLPYAMTAVLRSSRWPVIAATAMLSPLVSLAWIMLSHSI